MFLRKLDAEDPLRMKAPQILFSSDLYARHLTTIKNAYFTKREIDLMSCLLHVRGSSKKIATFLSISHKTVQKHIENIMSKVGCNATDSIINFVETSEALPFLRQYYSFLQREMIFEQSLKEIAKLNRGIKPFSYFIQDKNKDFLVTYLKSHLELIGCIVSTGIHQKESDYVIFILEQAINEEESLRQLQKIRQKTNKIFIILQEQKGDKEFSEQIKNFDIIDFSKEKNYYFSFFNLLNKLFPNLDLSSIQADFKNQYEKISVRHQWLKSSTKEGDKGNQPTHLPPNILHPPESKLGLFVHLLKLFGQRKDSRYFLSVLCVSSFIVGGFLVLLWNQMSTLGVILRSDLVIPKETTFLQSPELLKLIDDKFKGQKGIQTVAFVGQGGAGKTTLARQYAHEQKASCLWEINAETQVSLQTSFEKLAECLAKTDADQKILTGLFEIKDPLEKEKRIIQFVKEHLRSLPNWFLIYDNVEKFADIQKHFPSDTETWGMGKIILTTRDGNIENNSHVHHTVFIGELNPQQKLDLFTSVMTGRNTASLTDNQLKDMKCFLENIPPFPLDISVAAYYLKATNSSYAVYLENIALYNKEFESLQETLLKEAGDYTKTRYGIITLSLQHIINTHKDFKDLCVFISLVDSQNIPRELLNNFKNNVVVDNFIFNLKKYSLLINNPSNTALSIHRSTQAISLSYLMKKLELEKNKELITSIAKSLESSMDEVIKSEDFAKMEALINPCEIFLSHRRFLNEKIEGMIKSKLGTIHYFCGDNTKAKTLLKESLLQLRDSYEDKPTRIAFATGFLGNVLKDLGDFNEAKVLLQKSLSIYNQHCIDDPLRHAYFAVYLGIIDMFLGHYGTAKNAFEKGLTIHAGHFPENENFVAWASEQLGTLERKLGNYKKAEILLEKSLLSFTKDYHNDMDIAWALQHLGIVYVKLKKYDKAKDALEKSLKSWASTLPDNVGPLWALAHTSDPDGKHEDVKNLFDSLCKIYKGHFHENYIYAGLILGHLGNLYGKLGNYEKAKTLLKQSQFIYETNYGEAHLATAPILNDLGEIYLMQGYLEYAEDFINKGLLIFEKNKHPDAHECLENLSKLYILKAALELDNGKKEISQRLKAQARSYLNQALEVVKKYFPQSSPHEKRIQEKLTSFEMTS